MNINGGKFTVYDSRTTDGNTETIEGTVPEYSDLLAKFEKAITIDAASNNSCAARLEVIVQDNAGNESVEDIVFDIDTVAPEMTLVYDNNNVNKEVEGRGYFGQNRTATLTITERTSHFDEAEATENITITAVDSQGEKVAIDKTAMITWAHNVNTEDPDDDTHIATIEFTTDANYTLEIAEYVDKVGNVCSDIDEKDSVAPYTFTVDKVKPAGVITVGELGTWDKLIEILTFGLWTSETVTVSASSEDLTSPIHAVSYYKVSDTEALTRTELEAVDSWTLFEEFEVSANERFTVYLKIEDNAGNVEFISTNGIIVDEDAPAIEKFAPEITIKPEQPVNGFYNDDISIAVSVIDPENYGAYSGLRNIRYEVYNMGVLTQSDTLYAFDLLSPTQQELQQSWSAEEAFVVKAAMNNSNDVEVKVYATDNSNNEVVESIKLKVDITLPQISVKYNNNDGDSTFDKTTYFDDFRTATITITERNFNPDDVNVKITNTEDYIPKLSSWKTVKGSGNGDTTTHTATIQYAKDGDYTFKIAYSDLAGNKNTAVDYNDSLAPQKFTVDKTVPTFGIVYDNNAVLNGNYYKAERTATITVKEHNFETSRVDITLEATDNGTRSATPNVSKWTYKGNDTYVATIKFSNDSLYTFDFDYADKAGNKTRNIEPHVFYVDKTNPVVTISNITDNSANNDEGNIGFVISATDTNLDVFTPEVTVVAQDGSTNTVNLGSMANIANGRAYTVSNIEEDGIYRVTCSATDKAGNAYSQVVLEREDGSNYIENRSGNNTLVSFSVNRRGSNFVVDDNTAKLVEQYYIQNVNDTIKIIEINANELVESTVSVNGKELVEGKDYTVATTGGNGAWMQYTYSINKNLFEEEGEYNITVYSKDSANNDAFSDVKDAAIKFVVDRTAPRVTVAGLQTKGRYQVEKQIVTLIPTDDGGALKSLKVILVDEDGKTLEKLVDLSGEKLSEALESNGGKIVFEIAEGLYQNVRIICSDYATDENDDTNTYDDLFEEVSVSVSTAKILWANKTLRYSVFAGAAILGFIIFFIIFKKRKKEEDKK